MRTRPAPDSQAREATWQCKNPACKAVFVTWDQVIRIIDDPAQSHLMQSVAANLARMDAQQLGQVQLLLQGM